MIENEILINNCKCKIIFLFTGAKNIEVKAIPRKYRSELKQLFNELREYISPEEYIKFLSDCLDIKLEGPVELKGPVEQAENILKDFYKREDRNNGRN